MLPFVGLADLHRARLAIAEMCTLAPGRTRRRYVSRLMGKELPEHDPDEAARRERAINYVSPASLDEFRQRSLVQGTRVVTEYLAGGPIQPPLGTLPYSAT